MKTASAVLLAGVFGCALVQPAAAAGKAQEKVLYSFCGQKNCTDGYEPFDSLIDVNGTLYGTTEYGGANGEGTVYSLNPGGGSETVIYSFCSLSNCTDGEVPTAGLIDVKGTLYSVTYGGGANNHGAVFSLGLSGGETAIYSFCSAADCTDGASPAAGLVDAKGTLYGVTQTGGAENHGTVYSVGTSGGESVVYSFCSQSNCTDGDLPNASLIDVKGTLYGTTYQGGANSHGTVFSIDPGTGKETVLYSFCAQSNCTDGYEPDAALIDVKGMLYGTTAEGGVGGHGTVFALDPKTGKENVLYSFCSQANCADGAYPFSALIDEKGVLYGTTESGGANNHGAVFALVPKTGNEAVIYSFCSQSNCADGAYPESGLIDVKRTLYGTTESGGANNHGAAYAITHP